MSRLEAELTMHKEANTKLIHARGQLQSFVIELEEELEAMQSLIMARDTTE
jgi:hypothetical protein